MQPKKKAPWFLTSLTVTVAILCAGPFALPLVWMSPELKRWHKWFITVLIAVLTIWLFKTSVDLYKILLREIQSLQDAMR